MLTNNHKIQLRTAMDSIHLLGDDCWFEIAPHIYLKELEKNEHFSSEGQPIKDLGFIINGVMRIYYLNDKGEEWNKNFLQENDFVASSVSPEKKSITNIQALSKVLILNIPYVELMRVATKYKQVNMFIQKLTFEYLEQKQAREIRFLSEEAKSNYLKFKEQFPKLENKIQQYHIASYLGITPTQLSRLRKKKQKKVNVYQHM